jgi:hypothetical protein
LIDGPVITFIEVPASWHTTLRREEWSTDNSTAVLTIDKPEARKVVLDEVMQDYHVQYGTQAEIDARNEAERRAQNTARRRAQQEKRAESNNPNLRSLHSKVREMKKDGLTHQEMCQRLGSDPRPPGVIWGHLKWPEAFRNEKFQNAVRKWLTDACSQRKSRITKRKTF